MHPIPFTSSLFVRGTLYAEYFKVGLRNHFAAPNLAHYKCTWQITLFSFNKIPRFLIDALKGIVRVY